MPHLAIVAILLFSLSLSLFAAPPAAATESVRFEPLAAFKLTEPETCILDAAEPGFRFYPQSFFLRDDRLVIVNRHEPALVEVPLAGGKAKTLPLRQPADPKFTARFFIDGCAAGPSRFLLEQSTATLREGGPDGVLRETHLVSENEGQIISRVWHLTGRRFLFLDEGLHRIYVRDLANPAAAETPDATGPTFAFNGVDLAVGPAGLATIEFDAGRYEALLTPPEDTEAVTLVASWAADSVRALDADGASAYYFYVEDKGGAFIDAVDASRQPAAIRRYPVAKLAFPAEVTRIARAEKPGSLILLVAESGGLAFKRLTLPGR